MQLSSIAKGGLLKPPRVLIYGPAGVGKTTFGAEAPKPIFLPIEDGLGRIDADSFPTPKTYEDVRSALNALMNEEHEYRTLVVDSLDWLEPLIWQHTCQANNWKSIEQPGYGRGYVEALRYWREFLDQVNWLRDMKRMALVLISHSQVRRFDAPDSDGYDRYLIKLQQKAADLVSENCDCIFFADWQKTTIKTEEKGRTRTRGISQGERLIYTEERPAFIAKNRYGLPNQMPLNWQSFIDAYKA